MTSVASVEKARQVRGNARPAQRPHAMSLVQVVDGARFLAAAARRDSRAASTLGRGVSMVWTGSVGRPSSGSTGGDGTATGGAKGDVEIISFFLFFGKISEAFFHRSCLCKANCTLRES